MSNGRTTESPIPHDQAWPLEKRREDMRTVIQKAVDQGWVSFIKPAFLASTYGLPTIEADAELMRHLHEGEGK
jgi:hypothetical protein